MMKQTKFDFVKNDLKRYIKNCSLVVPSKATLPIIEYIKFYSEKGFQYFTSTNLEHTIIVSAGITTTVEDFAYLIDPKDLIKILDITDIPQISIEFKDDFSYTVYSGFDSWKFMASNAVDFPKTPEIENNNQISLNAEDYINKLKACLPFCADDQLRPIMEGVLHRVNDDKLILIATDSRKLIYYHDILIESIDKKEHDIILPKTCVKALNIFNPNKVDVITINEGNQCISLQVGQDTLITRKIDGNYPNAISIIDSCKQANTKKSIIDTKEFLKCVKKASICSNSASVLLALYLYNDEVRLQAEDVDLGKSSIVKLHHDYTGVEFVIGSSGAQLAEVLQSVPNDCSIEWCLNEPSQAMIFNVMNKDEYKNQMLLLMPMLLNSNEIPKRDKTGVDVVKEVKKEEKPKKEPKAKKEKVKEVVKEPEPVEEEVVYNSDDEPQQCPDCGEEYNGIECSACGYKVE